MTFWPKATLTLLPLPQQGQRFGRGGGTGAGSLSSLSVRGRDFLFRSFIDGIANLRGGEQRTQPEDTGGDKGCQSFPVQP